MSPFRALFAAERVKWRKSWLLVVAVLGPLCQTGFFTVAFWFSQDRLIMFKPAYQFWLELNFVLWNLALMPLATALICDLSWEQEREAKAWHVLMLHPVPRRGHYQVKLLSHLCLTLASLAWLIVLLLLGGALLQHHLGWLMGPLPLHTLLRFTGFSLLAPMAIVAFQTWLSFRLPGLWAGLASAAVGSWLTRSLVGSTALIQFLPWGFAAQMAIVFDRWRALPWAYAGGNLLVAGVLAALGTRDFVRRQDSRT